jgi:GPH family glycoside/pentoside/hexuronide:cation symporter
LIFALYLLIYVRMSASGSAVYYATYVLGDANYMTILSYASMLPSLAVLLFYSKVVAKFGGLRKTISIGLFLAIAGYLVMFIGSETPEIIIIGLVITSIGGGPLTAAGSALVADMGDYIYWESGIPVQGTAFSTTSAGMKIGQGIASAMVGWALAIGSYVPNAIQQPASAITAMKFLYIYFPLLICIVMVILMRFIDLEKYMPKVREEI